MQSARAVAFAAVAAVFTASCSSGGGSSEGPPTIASFTAAPQTTSCGGTSVLRWDCAGAASMWIDPDVGAVNGSTATVKPTSTTTYTLTARNEHGTVTAQTTIVVQSLQSEGAACTPANPCHQGKFTCGTGGPVCSDTGLHVADGTGCETGAVCSAGACLPVVCPPATTSCQPPNPCSTGVIECTAGPTQPGTCAATGNKRDGTDCGGGKVCNGGACVSPQCVAGASCEPATPCRSGSLSCPSGPTQPGTCVVTDPRPDGTSCGSRLVCSAGTCVAECVPDQSCTPAAPCTIGRTACATSWSSPVCNVVGLIPDGTLCGPGRICRAGACDDASLAVTLVTPVDGTHTNGTVRIFVSVSGGEPDRVDVLVDGEPLLQLVKPYELSWSTASLTEGTHHLAARATLAGRTFSSDPRTIIVDRSRPRVVKRVPAPNTANVWSRDPISATFSEPLNPSSVTDASVIVADNNSVQLAKSLALSADGLTLTITTLSLPAVPNQLTVALTAALLDVAGNPMESPLESWTWPLPVWQDLGVVGGWGKNMYPLDSLAVRGDGSIVVSTSTSSYDGGSEIEIAQWTGSTWERGTLPLPPLTVLRSASVAASTRKAAFIAWTANNTVPPGGPPNHLRVGYWSGSEWYLEPSNLEIDPTRDVGWATVATDEGGHLPLVAWTEHDYTTGYDFVYARRHNGSTWDRLGDSPINWNTSNAGVAEAAFNANGQPVVIWSGPLGYFVSVWDGTLWSSIHRVENWAPPSGSVAARHIGLDGNGHVAWVDSTTTPSRLYVNRIGGLLGSEQLGGAVNGGAGSIAGVPCLEVDGIGNPVVAWSETMGADPYASSLYVSKWDGVAWQQLGGSLAIQEFPPGCMSLVAGPSGVLALSISEWNSVALYGNRQRVVRYNR